MKIYRWLKDLTIEENIKRLTHYYVEHAITLGVKDPEKTVRKLIIQNRYTAGRILQQLKKLLPKEKMSKQEKGQPYFKRKRKSEIIECTARTSPLCLRRFVKTSEETVCLKCKINI